MRKPCEWERNETNCGKLNPNTYTEEVTTLRNKDFHLAAHERRFTQTLVAYLPTNHSNDLWAVYSQEHRRSCADAPRDGREERTLRFVEGALRHREETHEESNDQTGTNETKGIQVHYRV